MKLLLVLGSDETSDVITRFVKPLGFEIIRYYNVIKAMDNIDEADPTGIIISARDYPRHWKAMVQFVRTERSKSACPIIILKSDSFTSDDSSQASFLGVSGIVNESLENTAELSRIQDILYRYLPTDEKRRARRYNVQPWQRLKLAFVLPTEKKIITGELKTISLGGLSFLPDHSALMARVMLNDVLDECALRVGDDFLSPRCRLVRTGRIVSMEFVQMPDNDQKIIEDYLIRSPLTELRAKA